MRVIGAGFGRTGTDSIRHALERLLGAPCYHMKELVRRRDHAEHWVAFARNGCTGMDWRTLFAGYEATVDWPGANYYAQIMEAFPDAKVLLSVRDPDAWFDSFQTLVGITSVLDKLRFVPRLAEMKAFHDQAVWSMFTDLRDRASCIAVFERHIEEVKATVPSGRLLVYRVQEGWEPLCRFLEVDVPAEPFPHVNSRNEIRRFAARKVAGEIVRAPIEAVRSAFGGRRSRTS